MDAPGSYCWASVAGSDPAAPETSPLAGTPVEVLLVAHRRSGTDTAGISYSVSERLVFSDGTVAVLNEDRGFTIGPTLGEDSRAGQEPVEAELLRETVMAVVGPDEGEEEDQPWDRLAFLAGLRGLNLETSALRQLPLRIELA